MMSTIGINLFPVDLQQENMQGDWCDCFKTTLSAFSENILAI